MYVEDLDLPLHKVGETARRVIERAFEDAHRRRHRLVTTDHFLLALAQMKWDTFAVLMREIDVNPHAVCQAIEEQLRLQAPGEGRDMAVAPATRLVARLALQHASRTGRQTMEAVDLLCAIFEDKQAAHAAILRGYGVEPETVISRLRMRIGALELQEESLRKRLELPPHLKEFATNLNLLARQDRIPPVYGRDREIQQIVEILCHRERANSVMLVGEPGVGKTAIVEGLARRIEFEPDSLPVRWCQET